MSQKVEKVHNFIAPPPLPPDALDFFEFGKNWKYDDPPSLGLNLGKLLNWKNFEFWEAPLRKKPKSLKHFKFPKNHFKTNLFLFN